MHKLLRQQGMVVAPTSGVNSSEHILRYENYLTKKEPHLRVNKIALTTVATWCDNHQKQVVLADLPR
jgi:hypothetical protein